MSYEERKAMTETILAAHKSDAERKSIHPLVNKLLNDGFYLKVWNDRYSAGIRIALGREYSLDFEQVCQITDSSDIEALAFSDYLLSSGSWLPFECGVTVQESLDLLEAKLTRLPFAQLSRSSDWAIHYDNTLEKLLKIANGGYGLARAIDSGRLPPFKPLD
jgi:hypothetical protein